MDLATQISRACLRGRPCPPSLLALCASDPDSLRAYGLERLLTSLDVLEAGYGAAIEAESADIAANVRAHRRIFERLGFFAEGDEGELWALDLASDVAEPPAAALDTEGQYSWIGLNLADALRRDGRYVSTQFLPQLSDLHAEYYALESGSPRSKRVPASRLAHDADPESWLLRPGAEVAAVLASTLPVDEQLVACGGDGLVTTIWLPRAGALSSLPVRGIALGAEAISVRERLGRPTREAPGWMRFDESDRALHFEVDDGVVTRITLMALDDAPV